MKLIKKSIWAWACIFLVGSIGCGGDEAAKKVSNLIVTVVVDENGSGEVVINAGADNEKFFKFFLGESVDEEPIITDLGFVSHTYEESGTYTIKIQAHSSEADFISYVEIIEVDVFIPIPTTGNTSPESYEGWTLLWQDEFNETTIDATKWTFEIGNGTNGWGNNELQYYRQQNASIIDGNLMIEAKAEEVGGKNYTSTRMVTRDKFEFKYGRVDVRAALPEGQGIWPAIWLLGANYNDLAFVWPKCGEIDIMEMVGGSGREKTVHGTVHWWAEAYASYGKSYSLATGIFKDEFHVFSIEWNETYIIWYVDDVEFNRIDITPAGLSEFHENFFFILNVAVGGNWPGSPDNSTRFPQRMFVDYIRVFQPQ